MLAGAVNLDFMPLSLQLRYRTRREHEQTESSSLMQEVMGTSFQFKHYVTLLKRFATVYLPLETAIISFLRSSSLHYSYSSKLPLLAQDLKACGEQFPHVVSDIPDVTTTSCFLGALYVVEGSTLGGSVIRKHLASYIDINHQSRFLYPYGTDTGQHWKTTQAFIDKTASDQHLDNMIVCEAANRVFRCIRRALDDTSIN